LLNFLENCPRLKNKTEFNFSPDCSGILFWWSLSEVEGNAKKDTAESGTGFEKKQKSSSSFF